MALEKPETAGCVWISKCTLFCRLALDGAKILGILDCWLLLGAGQRQPVREGYNELEVNGLNSSFPISLDNFAHVLSLHSVFSSHCFRHASLSLVIILMRSGFTFFLHIHTCFFLPVVYFSNDLSAPAGAVLQKICLRDLKH